MGGMMQNGMMGGVTMGLGWLFPILGLTILGLLIAWLVRAIRHGTEDGASTARPLEIARRRYARGEIDAEELRTIRETLAG